MQKVDYDEISQVYDDVREGDLVLVNRFLPEISLRSDFKILDIGCGTGNYTDILQRLTGAQVYGIEPSEGMLDKAREYWKKSIGSDVKGDDEFLKERVENKLQQLP